MCLLDGRLWPINYETGESVSTVLSVVALRRAFILTFGVTSLV